MLPILSVVPQIIDALRASQDVFLIAPPGAGKSTYVPHALLKLDCFEQKTIIMLQPRRVAARNIARFISKSLGEKLGETVGFIIKGERKVSAKTRLLIVTEGVLSNMICADPELSNVACIIFDEFHERSIHADLAFALVKDSQQGLREDLRIILMSATLDKTLATRVMPEAKLIESKGRTYPVALIYTETDTLTDNLQRVCNTVSDALTEHEGDLLCFLSGIRDIRDLQRLLSGRLSGDIEIHVLHSSISNDAQDAALNVSKTGQRKVILATNIAETSLTIDGVKIVVDTGREKTSTFNFAKGSYVLNTRMISQASATQRAGRAGRLDKGVCYRMWSSAMQDRLSEHPKPEILRSDISETLLKVLDWGANIDALAFVDIPSDAQQQYAYANLSQLGLLTTKQTINEKGRRINQVGLPLRLANLLVCAKQQNEHVRRLTAIVIALLDSPSTAIAQSSNELNARFDLLLKSRHDSTWKHVEKWSDRLNVTYKQPALGATLSPVLPLLLSCYIDRVGKCKTDRQYHLHNATQVFLHAVTDRTVNWIVCFDYYCNDKNKAMISAYMNMSDVDITDFVLSHSQTDIENVWETKSKKVTQRKRKSFGDIVLSNEAMPLALDEQCTALVFDNTTQSEFEHILMQSNGGSFFKKLVALQAIETQPGLDNMPKFSKHEFYSERKQTIAAFNPILGNQQALIKLDWLSMLKNKFNWHQLEQIEKAFPTSFMCPLNQQHRLDYKDDGQVILSIRMQSLYGLNAHPSIAFGSIPLTLSILSPARREIQKTKDLVSFWDGSYHDVKKEMKGRYPKHLWPDDPANSLPTSKTKKRS